MVSVAEVDGCPYQYRLHMISLVVSPYVGHDFEVLVSFRPQYSLMAAKFAIKFDGDLFHPNFSEFVNIQLDIVCERWSHAFTVTDILVAILGLLCAPNLDGHHQILRVFH
ncbi:hypothetical protein V6N13_034286 [Hibiscus sabdariffa]